MKTLYQLFKKPGEHRFPFELLEHFDLESAKELGDVASGQVFHEIVFREKNIEPAVCIKRTFSDFDIQGVPVFITFQRNLIYHPKHGLRYCNNYAALATKLCLHEDIKRFLSDDYKIAELGQRDAHKRKIA
ncbi:MAG: hypothetical protein EAS52_15710 [Parapedobacter sp.]|nr:MAG: hypothetical protein EAS52_15710 [Parapedobacter sp.]